MNTKELDAVTKLFNEALPFILSDETYGFLQRLPKKQRLCFLLRNAYGYSYKQISTTLQISVRAVHSNLTRANARKPHIDDQKRDLLKDKQSEQIMQDGMTEAGESCTRKPDLEYYDKYT